MAQYTPRRLLSAAVGLTLAVVASGATPTWAQTTAAPDWGSVVQLPGLARLTGATDQPPTVAQVCANADRCVAFGSFGEASPEFFVDQRIGGVWGTASEVPGLAAFVGTQGIREGQLECFTVDLCLAVADYAHGVAVVEYDAGTWSQVERLQATVPLAAQPDTLASPVCSAPGDCVVGGSYWKGHAVHAYLAIQRGGAWGAAFEVRGVAALEGTLGSSMVTQLECPTSGNCIAAGWYDTNPNTYQLLPFMAVESAGRWASAQALPWLDSQAQGHRAEIQQISCPFIGSCTIAGYLLTTTDRYRYFALTERGGHVLTRTLLGRPSTTGSTYPMIDLQCPTAWLCTVVAERDAIVGTESYALTLSDGVPGPTTDVSQVGGGIGPNALSCPSAGNCGLVIDFWTSSGTTGVATATETDFTWSPATPATVFPSYGAPDMGITSVECLSMAYCTISGWLGGATAYGFVSH